MRVSRDEGIVRVELSNGDFGVMFLDGVRRLEGRIELDLLINDNHACYELCNPYVCSESALAVIY